MAEGMDQSAASYRLPGFDNFSNLNIPAVEKPSVLKMGHVLYLYRAYKSIKNHTGSNKSAVYFDKFVPLLRHLNDCPEIAVHEHMDVRGDLDAVNNNLFHAKSWRLKVGFAAFTTAMEEPFFTVLITKQVDKLSEFSLLQEKKIKQLTTEVSQLHALVSKLRRSLNKRTEEDVEDDSSLADPDYVLNSSAPTSPSKPVSQLTPRKANARCTTSGNRNAPFDESVKALFIILIGEVGLSAHHAQVAFRETAKVLGVEIKPPSDRTIQDWGLSLVGLNMANTAQKLSTAGDYLAAQADATSKSFNKKLKTGVSVVGFQSANGSIMLPCFATPDKSGQTLGDEMIKALLESGQMFYELTGDEDPRTKSIQLMKNVLINVTAFVGDGGAENNTFVDYIRIAKQLICGDEHEFRNLPEDERWLLLSTKFAKLRQLSFLSQTPALVRYHCALHMVALFANYFMQVVDNWYEDARAACYPEHVFKSNPFSSQAESFFSLVECRGDSLVSVGNFFHGDKERRSKLNEYNSFNKSGHNRDHVKLMNLGALRFWRDEMGVFFTALQLGDNAGRYQNALNFLNDSLCMSAVQTGAVLYHYLLLPMLCETSKLIGEPALRVQKELLVYLEKCSGVADVQKFLQGDMSYIEEIGYGVKPSHAQVMEKIVSARIVTDQEVICTAAVMNRTALQLKKYQPCIKKYYEEMSTEEQQEFAKSAKNLPAHNDRCESVFSRIVHTVSQNPNQGFAVSVSKANFRGTNELSTLISNNKELFRTAVKRRKSDAKQQEMKAYEAQEKNLKRLCKRSDEKKNEKNKLLYKLLDDVTGEIQNCVGGLWQNADEATNALKVLLPPAPKLFRGKLSQPKLAPGVTAERMIAEALRAQQFQVKFWKEAVLNRFGVQLKVSGKNADDMNNEECMEFLSTVWKHTNLHGATATAHKGRVVQMEFVENGVTKLYDGIVAGRLPWDTTHTNYYIRFDNEPTMYPYDLPFEMENQHVKNIDEVRSWLDELVSPAPVVPYSAVNVARSEDVEVFGTISDREVYDPAEAQRLLAEGWGFTRVIRE